MAKKILIVDDEPAIVTMVSNRLKANGYDCISAKDGQEGLTMAKKEKPDLIILDLMLPKMDGYKVCSLIKKDSRYAKIPIILFTAKVQAEDSKLGEEVGADAYVVKPFNAQLLLEKIQQLTEKGSSTGVPAG